MRHRSAGPQWRIAILCLLAAAPLSAQNDQVVALREGNRLFRDGRIEEAYAAYLEGYDAAAPHPVLSYNLGTAAHHLDRLPEAILWYRRAADVNPGDPWLDENLETARATLGLQPYPAPGLGGLASRQARNLYYLAALIAWIGAALWIARPRSHLRPTLTLLVVALAVYGGALLAGSWAPVPAVVTQECSSAEGDLLVGSEVWIVDHEGDTVRIAAGGLQLTCPAGAIAEISGGDQRNPGR